MTEPRPGAPTVDPQAQPVEVRDPGSVGAQTGLYPSLRNHSGAAADKVGMTVVPRVLYLADDAEIARLVLRMFKSAAFQPIEVIHAETIAQAVAILRSSPRFDGYVIDWRLDGGRTCESVLAAIRGLDPKGLVCIFTGSSDDPELCRAAWTTFKCAVMPRRSGAPAWRSFFRAVATAAEAERQREDQLATRAAPNELTPRELLVLQAALDGASDRWIAAALGVAESRVHVVLTECAEKLGASSVEDMLRPAL